MEENNSFDKEKSTIVKGFAILCMITYHVWGINKYKPILGYKFNIERFIGQFGHICVPIYLFLSGYAMYIIYCKNNFRYTDLIKRIFKLLLRYWLIFILFIPLGFKVFNIYTFNINEIFLNFTTIKISYNGDWWFLRLYIQLTLIFPLFLYIIKRNSIRKSIIVSGMIYLLGFLMFWAFKVNFSNITKMTIYQDIQVILVDQLIFTVGCIFAKNNIFNQIENILKKYDLNKLRLYFLALLVIFIFRSIMYVFFEDIIKFGSPDWFDFIIVPIIITCIYNIFSKGFFKKVMIILGKNSDNMWLTHTFFYKLYFHNIIYSFESSILILILVISFSFISSIIINFLYNHIKKGIDIFIKSKKSINIKI